MTRKELAALIDQTALGSGLSEEYIRSFCREAMAEGFASVCILPNMVPAAAQVLSGSATKVCTVISFPLGMDLPETKIFETGDALQKGAQEIDLVLNVGAFKSGDYSALERELSGVIGAAHAAGALAKVIIETPLLTSRQIHEAALLCEGYGADIVKTSTGYRPILPRSTSVEDVKLLRSILRRETGIKAAGGIRSVQDALRMLAAGATRIGASCGVEILTGLAEQPPVRNLSV